MQLYLVQHGAAKSEAEDPQRRLTAKGTLRVERTAEYLASRRLHLDRIEHSDKERARQTAEIMAAHVHPAEGTRQVAGLAPNDDIGPMQKRLQNESSSLMIVGHLPYLSRLLSVLVGAQPERTLVNFQMGGVVHLERDTSDCSVRSSDRFGCTRGRRRAADGQQLPVSQDHAHPDCHSAAIDLVQPAPRQEADLKGVPFEKERCSC